MFVFREKSYICLSTKNDQAIKSQKIQPSHDSFSEQKIEYYYMHTIQCNMIMEKQSVKFTIEFEDDRE